LTLKAWRGGQQRPPDGSLITDKIRSDAFHRIPVFQSVAADAVAGPIPTFRNERIDITLGDERMMLGVPSPRMCGWFMATRGQAREREMATETVTSRRRRHRRRRRRRRMHRR